MTNSMTYLNTVTVHVRHYDVSLRIHRNVAWVIQLAIAVSKRTKLERLT